MFLQKPYSPSRWWQPDQQIKPLELSPSEMSAVTGLHRHTAKFWNLQAGELTQHLNPFQLELTHHPHDLAHLRAIDHVFCQIQFNRCVIVCSPHLNLLPLVSCWFWNMLLTARVGAFHISTTAGLAVISLFNLRIWAPSECWQLLLRLSGNSRWRSS